MLARAPRPGYTLLKLRREPAVEIYHSINSRGGITVKMVYHRLLSQGSSLFTGVSPAAFMSVNPLRHSHLIQGRKWETTGREAVPEKETLLFVEEGPSRLPSEAHEADDSQVENSRPKRRAPWAVPKKTLIPTTSVESIPNMSNEYSFDFTYLAHPEVLHATESHNVPPATYPQAQNTEAGSSRLPIEEADDGEVENPRPKKRARRADPKKTPKHGVRNFWFLYVSTLTECRFSTTSAPMQVDGQEPAAGTGPSRSLQPASEPSP